MNVQDAIQNRRAIKAYDKDFKISDADFKKLMELVILSPTSFNIQNWRLVRVTDAEKRAQIRAAGWDQAQLTEASECIILCADVKSWENDPKRYWDGAPSEVQDYLAKATIDFYNGREWIQRDEAMRSVGMAAQTLMLAAQGMGLDSGPMIGFDQDVVAKIINLPKDHVIGMIVVIGKKLSEARPRTGRLSVDQVVFENNF